MIFCRRSADTSPSIFRRYFPSSVPRPHREGTLTVCLAAAYGGLNASCTQKQEMHSLHPLLSVKDHSGKDCFFSLLFLSEDTAETQACTKYEWLIEAFVTAPVVFNACCFQHRSSPLRLLSYIVPYEVSSVFPEHRILHSPKKTVSGSSSRTAFRQ